MRLLLLSALLLISTASRAIDSETLIWNKSPLSIALPVGVERIISFKRPTQLQLSADIVEDVEYTILEGTHYYLKAKKAFKQQRIFATSESGEQFIFELSARKSAPSHLLSILSESDAIDGIDKTKSGAVAPQPKLGLNDHYIRMTRFASQQLYAPSRLLTADTDLSRVKVEREQQKLLKVTPEIEAVPLSQWRSKTTGLYVTAIQLTNMARYGVPLDPRNIRGQFVTSVLQHGFLSKKGSAESVSAMYLVSQIPFEEALGAWATN